MKEIVLAPGLLLIFAGVYYALKKLFSFTSGEAVSPGEPGCRRLRIYAEGPELLRGIQGTLDYCAGVSPYLTYETGSKSRRRLLADLRCGNAELALFRRDSVRVPESGLSYLALPSPALCLVWNSARPSAGRDRLLAELRRHHIG